MRRTAGQHFQAYIQRTMQNLAAEDAEREAMNAPAPEGALTILILARRTLTSEHSPRPAQANARGPRRASSVTAPRRSRISIADSVWQSGGG
jgi:hypothetical protein